MFKFQKNGLLYCEYCNKKEEQDKTLQKQITHSNEYLKRIDSNINKLLQSSRNRNDNFTNDVNKNEKEEKESCFEFKQVKTAREQINATNNKDKKIKVDLSNVDLKKPFEVATEAYYKAYEEIKTNLFTPLKNAFLNIAGFLKKREKTKETEFIEAPKSGVLNKYRNLLSKNRAKENTKEYRSYIQQISEENVKENKKQTELLEDIKRGNRHSSGLLGKYFTFLLSVLKPLKGIMNKILKLLPLIVSSFEIFKKLTPKSLKKNIKEKVKSTKEKVKPLSKNEKNNKIKNTEKDFVKKEAKKEAIKNEEKIISKVGEKEFIKTSEKSLFKSALKKIPLFGVLAGSGFAYKRLKEGDTKGAGLELLSGVLSLIPGIGTAGSIAIDAYLAKRDFDKLNKGNHSYTEKADFNKIIIPSDVKATKISNDAIFTQRLMNEYSFKESSKDEGEKTLSPEIKKLLTEQTDLLKIIAQKDTNVNVKSPDVSVKIPESKVNNTIIYAPTKQYQKGIK